MELTTSASRLLSDTKLSDIRAICGMCEHKMELLSGDNQTLECGHEFHSVCIDSWPINLECPQCIHHSKHRKSIFEENQDIDDSDDELEPISDDTACKLNRNIQLL